MPSWTPSKTWTSENLTQGDLNTYLRDNTEYLKGIVDGTSYMGVQVTRSGAQSVASSSSTTVIFTAEVSGSDVGGWWSSGSAIIVPSGAVPSGGTVICVHVEAEATFGSDSTGQRIMNLYHNGDQQLPGRIVPAVNGDATSFGMSRYLFAQAGDEINLRVYQNSGGNLDLTNVVVSVVRVGLAS